MLPTLADRPADLAPDESVRCIVRLPRERRLPQALHNSSQHAAILCLENGSLLVISQPFSALRTAAFYLHHNHRHRTRTRDSQANLIHTSNRWGSFLMSCGSRVNPPTNRKKSALFAGPKPWSTFLRQSIHANEGQPAESHSRHVQRNNSVINKRLRHHTTPALRGG